MLFRSLDIGKSETVLKVFSTAGFVHGFKAIGTLLEPKGLKDYREGQH